MSVPCCGEIWPFWWPFACLYSEISWQVAQLQVKEKVRTLWPVDPRDFRFASGKYKLGREMNCSFWLQICNWGKFGELFTPSTKTTFSLPSTQNCSFASCDFGGRWEKANTEVFCEHQNHFALTYSWWKKALYHLRMCGNKTQIIHCTLSILIISDNILWLLQYICLKTNILHLLVDFCFLQVMELMAAPDQKSREVRREALLCCWVNPGSVAVAVGVGRCEKQCKMRLWKKGNERNLCWRKPDVNERLKSRMHQIETWIS